MSDTLTAVIPARSGSRRVPNKNLMDFCGEPLLVRKVRQLKEVAGIHRVVVTSDSDHYLDLAREAGAETHKREGIYCDEVSVPFGEVVRHVAQSLPGDHLMWAPCTSPLVLPPTYHQAIIEYFSGLHKGFDSLVSFEPFKRYVWDEEGPSNYNLGLGHVISQNLPALYFMANAFMIAPREKMIEWSYFHGQKPRKFLLGKKEAADIDDALDLRCARAYAGEV